MSTSVQPPASCVDLGLELDELVLAGDDNAWSMEDWSWDGKAFAATPAAGAVAIRAGKRHCSGLQLPFPDAASALCNPSAACCGGSMTAVGFDDADTPSGSIKDPDPLTADSPEAGKAGSATHGMCQVEDCGRELSGLSTYYQRCRICEVHIKEPQFMRAGKIQRFCQQCGRCHELSAFHGSKRSCKDQLAKHNARRRRRAEKKHAEAALQSQPEALSASSPCQSRLASAFASLGPWLSQGQVSQNNAAPGQSMPTSVGFPLQPGTCSPAAFPAASLAFPLGPKDSSGRLPMLPYDCEDSTAEQGTVMQQAIAMRLENKHQEGPALGIPWPGLGAVNQVSAMGADSSFKAAMAMMCQASASQTSLAAPQYQAEHLVVRLSVKLFNCTPAELPADLKQQLTGWLKSTPAGAEGYLRPGCVHLVAQAHVPAHLAAQIEEGGIQAVTSHLASQQHQVWSNHVVLLELNGQVALMKDGQLLSMWDVSATKAGPDHMPLAAFQPAKHAVPPLSNSPGSLVPQVYAAAPAAVFLGEDTDGASIRIHGQGIACGNSKVFCRSAGRYIKINCQPFSACCQPGEGHSALEMQQSLDVKLPSGLTAGLAWLEVQRGCLLSKPLPVLLPPSKELADEVCNVLSRSAASKPPGPNQEGLLMDLGLLIGSTPDASKMLEPTAIRLAEWACKADMPALLAYIAHNHLQALPIAAGQMTLLHLCVQHGSHAALFSALQIPGMQADMPGPQGITPLHLSAISAHKGSIQAARLLITHCSSASAWISRLTVDGLSPSDFAKRVGAHALDNEMTALAAASANIIIADNNPIATAEFGVAEQPAAAAVGAAVPPAGCSVQYVAEQDYKPPTFCAIDIDMDARPLSESDSGLEDTPLLEPATADMPQSALAIRCAGWQGPLADAVPRGLLGYRSSVALLGIVACLGTCVVLLRDRVV